MNTKEGDNNTTKSRKREKLPFILVIIYISLVAEKLKKKIEKVQEKMRDRLELNE